MRGSEFIQDIENCGGYNDRTRHDSQGYHIALVFPIDNPAGWATAAQKGMRILFLTVAARSCDRAEHAQILTR